MTKKKMWYKDTTLPRVILLLGIGIFAISSTMFSLQIEEPKQKQEYNNELYTQKTKQEIQYLIRVIKKEQPKLDIVVVDKIAEAIHKYSKQYNFPYELILAVISRESTFNPLAISKASCIGLMQINAKFHTEKLDKLKAKNSDLFHIDTNIHVGCMILSEYYKQTGAIEKALAKYVGGNQKAYICDILSNYTNLTIQK